VADDIATVRARLSTKLERTASLEAELGRAGFGDLPERTQAQLSVLQSQAEPKAGASLESLLGSEHNLDAYEAKLREALDLLHQMRGERGRKRTAIARRGRQLMLAAAMIGVVLAAGAIYLRQALGTKATACADGPGCVQSGLCGATVSLKGSPSIVCAPRDDDDCQRAKDCSVNGRCRKLGAECGAESDADCATLDLCTTFGFCSAVDGSCVPAKDQDCRRIPACTERGLCTPLDGVCKAGSDADCRQSELCQKSQACVEVGGECVRPPEDFEGAGHPAGSATPGPKGGKAP
jgi:hypothetical protein